MTTIRFKEMIIPLATGWEDQTQVVAVNKLTDVFQPNMVVSCEAVEDTVTPEKHAKRSLPSLRSALPAFVLDEEGLAAFGPWTGYQMVYRFDARGNITLKQIQWYVKDARQMYTFTCTDILSRFDATRSDAEKMFSQFRIA
jgi:hypothetical protein